MKHTKGYVAIILIFSLLFTLLTAFITVEATAETVYYHNFNTDGLGNENYGYWHAFPANGGPELAVSLFETYPGEYLSETDTYLRVRNITKSWYSPCLNVYNIFKNNGAGTYFISIKVACKGEFSYGDKGTSIVIRGASSADKNSFIKLQSNGTYYKTLGSEYYLYQNQAYSMDGIAWSEITGTVKILKTDITRANGTFNLCLSNLPVGIDEEMYVESVKIVKYDEEQITNGNFSSNLDGWCVWTDKAYSQPMHQGYTDYTGDASLQCKLDYENSFLYGRYVRTTTYG